uniref:Cytochrome b561 domain-containing protein n=1 Tax=Alexandrium catenella TaxID=2925 RepID=A0A7S1W0N3_ALECA
MEALSFVPKYPLLGHALAASALLGVPMAVRALVVEGGPARTRLAAALGLALATALTVLTLLKGNNLFVWHVIGMAGAVFGLQPAAIHSILAKHSFTDASRRASRATDHKLLQIAVIGSVGAAFLAIYLNKPAGFPGKHFMSVHSLVGLVAILLMLGNAAHGAYRQGSPLAPKLNWVSRLHRVAGTCAFCFSVLAAVLGFFNRTAVVDWEQRPIRFSLPPTWNQMGGWAASTHGVGLAWAFIGTSLVILGLMLGGRGAPVKAPSHKRK